VLVGEGNGGWGVGGWVWWVGQSGGGFVECHEETMETAVVWCGGNHRPLLVGFLWPLGPGGFITYRRRINVVF